MAILFCDSFDHYPNSQALRKWTSSRNTPPTNFITASGRFGQGWSGGERHSEKVLSASYSTLIVGFAITRSSSLNDAIVGFQDAGSYQTELRYNSATNLFTVTRNGTAIGSTIPYVWNLNQWIYVEFKVTFNDTTGAFELRVDGTSLSSQSSLDTKNTANATANGIRIGSGADAALSIAIDDLVVLDTTDSGVSGNPCNDFLGDIRVECLFPNGNGNSSVLVGSDGNSTDNYLLVDDGAAGADDDSTYVESGTVGDKDTYTYTDLTPTSGTVYAIQTLPTARKTDAGTRTMVTVMRTSATEQDSSAFTLGTTFASIQSDIRHSKPGGAQPSISDINASEFGIKVAS